MFYDNATLRASSVKILEVINILRTERGYTSFGNIFKE